MELFDRYLQCVSALLPSGRKADILEELSDDLRSQAEEREAELGRPLFLEEQSAILKASGHPLQVAMRYRNLRQQQLIGPLLFPLYWFALKVLLVIVGSVYIITSFVIVAGGESAGQAVDSLLRLPRVLLPAFAVVTLVFALLDYLQVKFRLLELWNAKWNPLELPTISRHKPQPRPLQTIFHAISGVLFLCYLLVAKHVPYLFFGPAAAYLQPGPSWHRIYLPLVGFVALGVVVQSIALFRPRWKWFSPAAEITLNLLGLILLRLALKLPPYFVAPRGVAALPSYAHMADIVNQSIYWSFWGVSIGLLVACIVDGWALFLQIRADGGRDPGQATSQNC